MKNSMKRAKIFTLMMSILVGVSISMFVSFAEGETVDIDMSKGDASIYVKSDDSGSTSTVIAQGDGETKTETDVGTNDTIRITGSSTGDNTITVDGGVELNELSIGYEEGDSELTISTLSRKTAKVSTISSDRPLNISSSGTLNIGALSGTSVEVSSSGIVNLNGSVDCSGDFNITSGKVNATSISANDITISKGTLTATEAIKFTEKFALSGGSVTANAGIICSEEKGTFVMTGGTLTAKVESGAAISAATIDVKEAESGGLTQGGYIFLEGNDAESAKLSSTQSLTVADEKTAAYVHVYPGYELKYDDNTEEVTTGTMETKYTSSAAGKAITVDKCGFDRPGYILKNWNTQADGRGTEYVPGEAITMGADTTLYAQWVQGYKVTYTDGVEDEEIFADVVYEVEQGGAIPAFGDNPDRTGYTFAGWNPKIEDTVTQNVTYTAQWEANIYTIVLEAGDGGTDGEATVYYDSDALIIEQDKAPTKAGYTLTGYYTTDGADGTKVAAENGNLVEGTVEGYTKEGKWIHAENTTLYAQWEEEKCTITYYHNDGTDNYTQKTYSKGQEISLWDGNEIAIKDHTLEGWSTEKQGVPFYSPPDVSTTLEADSMTLYAVWDPPIEEVETCTITLNGNGGTFGGNETLDITATVGSSTLPDITAPLKEGYSLTGYYTAAGNGNKIINADGSLVVYSENVKDYIDSEGNWINTSETVILYAQWEANKYTITLDKNGGEFEEGATTDVYIKYDTNQFIDADNTAASVPIPSQEGYTFAGYYTEKTAGSEVIDKDGNLVGSVTDYTDEEGKWINTSETVTLYAQWSETGETKYTVTYTDGVEDEEIFEDVVYEVEAGESTPESNISKDIRTGYTLTKWNPDLADTVTQNVTYTAQWQAKEYTITLNGNGGQFTAGETTDVYIKYDTSQFIDAEDNEVNVPIPSQEGYTFAGYYAATENGNKIINADGSLVEYSDNVKDYISAEGNWINTSETVTLYAQWEANKYTITLNGNGGKFGEKETLEITATVGSSTLLDITAPLKEGYSLTGYYTATENGNKIINADGTLVKGVAGYTDSNGNWINTSETVTLYAQWEANKYTITLNENGGQFTAEETTDIYIKYDTSQFIDAEDNEVNVPIPSQEGYTFSGYYTAAENGNKIINADGTLVKGVAGYTDSNGNWINTSETVTLYAQWEANKYTITLDENGGEFEEGATTDVYIKYDTNQFIDAEDNEVNMPIPSQEGYTFSGYYTAAENGNKIINADGTLVTDVEGYTDSDGNWINTSETVTLYAQWEANKYTITLDGNGGTDGKATVYYDSDALEIINAPTKAGYTLTGYYTIDRIKVADANGKLVAYTEEVGEYIGESGKWINTTETVTLYANWEANTYLVQFNKNAEDATGEMQAQNFIYDQKQKLNTNTFSRQGYKFSGWNTVSDGSGDKYDDVQEVSNLVESGVVELYAQWNKENEEVIVNDNPQDNQKSSEENVVVSDSTGVNANGSNITTGQSFSQIYLALELISVLLLIIYFIYFKKRFA